MQISIVMPTLNSERHIEEALSSFAVQNYKNKELIVVDGGSSDNTLTIAKNSRIATKVIEYKGSSIYEALNKGIEESSGEIIGVLHSDDIYPFNHVLSLVVGTFLAKDPDLVYGDLIYFRSNSPGTAVRYWKSGMFTVAKLKQGWMPPHPTVFIKKNVYKRYGTYDTSLSIAADYELLLRVLNKNINVAYIPVILYKMRIGGVSNRNLKHIIKKSIEDLIILKRYKGYGVRTLLLKNITKLPQLFAKSISEEINV